MRIIDKNIDLGQPHVSDEDLLLSIDGELPLNRRTSIQKHLEACWECRARLIELQNTISEFIRIHHGQFDNNLPPLDGPRALLRAQLRQMGAQSKRSLMDKIGIRMDMGGRALPVTTAVLVISMAVILLVAFQHGWRANNLYNAMPRASLTPGATVPVSVANICSAGFPTERTVTLPSSLKRTVFERYRMSNARPEDFEVDYLITPDLGGATTIRNLWPEPYYSTVWNARVKDQLEIRLKDLVCSGKLDLATAQHDISSDWIAAYKKYFRTSIPLNIPQPMMILVAQVSSPRDRF